MDIKVYLQKELEGFVWPERFTVLVCGGRDFGNLEPDDPYVMALKFKERYFVWDVLRALGLLARPAATFTLVEGGARGADECAARWIDLYVDPSGQSGWYHRQFKADWKTHGRSAGSIRNQQMLFESKPDLVLAFPGGNGTADMVRKARRAGVKTIEVPYPF